MVVITTAQLIQLSLNSGSTQGSNPPRTMSEIHVSEDLWQ